MNSEQVGPQPTAGGGGYYSCTGAGSLVGSECECERRTGASRAGPGRHHCGAGRDHPGENEAMENDDEDDWLYR